MTDLTGRDLENYLVATDSALWKQGHQIDDLAAANVHLRREVNQLTALVERLTERNKRLQMEKHERRNGDTRPLFLTDRDVAAEYHVEGEGAQ